MDPLSLEFLFQNVPEVSLLDAARDMEGVEFYHGVRRVTMKFQFVLVEPALRVCLEWAESNGPEDARQAMGLEKLAAVRAWTCTALCYVLTTVLRDKQRTAVSVQPVLKYGNLFFSGLHAMPAVYLVMDATLYRAENGVMEGWDAKMRPPDGIFSFWVPTSFSTDPAVLRNFKDTDGPRTMFEIVGASGYNMAPFSAHDEKEVLIEGVSNFQVIRADKFNAEHPDVQSGEVKEGLHKVKGHVRPGVEMLEGSPVKAAEVEAYRKWQEKEQRDREQKGALDLELDPFTEAEWTAKGKLVPKKDKERRMSTLGKGAFMTTLRKRLRRGAAGPDGVTQFAVKVVDREDMGSKGITEADVRREARILERLRHSHIIRYYGVETSEEEIGIVMELAAGGSVADLIKTRAAAGAGPEGLTRTELYGILEQMANALDYLHGQGVVHRDIKADNILLAHAPGAGPLRIKVADFGVAAALSSTLGSVFQTLASGAGTRPYFAPERENQMAYGAMADMWALGCLMLELASLLRLDRGLGRIEPEHERRRTDLLRQVL